MRVSRGSRRSIDSGPSLPVGASGAYLRPSVEDEVVETADSVVAAVDRLRTEPAGEGLELCSWAWRGVSASGDVTSVRGWVGGGLDVDLDIDGDAGVSTGGSGGGRIGGLRAPSMVAARMRGLVGVGELRIGEFTVDVGGTTANTNCLLVYGVTGADSV